MEGYIISEHQWNAKGSLIVETLVKTSENILTGTLNILTAVLVYITCVLCIVYITYTSELKKKLNEKNVLILNSIQLLGCTIVTFINFGLLLVKMESPVDWSPIGGIGIGSFTFPSSSFHKCLTGARLPVVFSGTGSGFAAGKT